MTEIEAKVSYVKLARSLKTYGVSFFLVKVGGNTFVCLSLFCFPFVCLACLLQKWEKVNNPLKVIRSEVYTTKKVHHS